MYINVKNHSTLQLLAPLVSNICQLVAAFVFSYWTYRQVDSVELSLTSGLTCGCAGFIILLD